MLAISRHKTWRDYQFFSLSKHIILIYYNLELHLKEGTLNFQRYSSAEIFHTGVCVLRSLSRRSGICTFEQWLCWSNDFGLLKGVVSVLDKLEELCCTCWRKCVTSLWPRGVLYNMALNSWFYFAVLLCLVGMLLKLGKKGFSSVVFGFFFFCVCYDEKLYMLQCVFVTVANSIDQNTKIGPYHVNYDVF